MSSTVSSLASARNRVTASSENSPNSISGRTSIPIVNSKVLALVIRGDRDLRLHGRAERALLDRFARARLDGLLKHLAQHARLVVAAHDRERHLAAPEALHGHGLAQLVEPALDIGLEIGGRHRHLELAPQPLREGFPSPA